MGPIRHIFSRLLRPVVGVCLVVALTGAGARAQPPHAAGANGEANTAAATASARPASTRPARAPASAPADSRAALRRVARRLGGNPGSNSNAKPDPDHAAAGGADADPSRPASDHAADSHRSSGPLPPIERTPLGQPRPSTPPGQASKPGGAGGMSWVLSTMAALGVVIALILAARWAYQKLGGRVVHSRHPAVEVLGRTAVAPKNHVVLLRVGQRVLVVGDSPQGLSPLANLDDPDEVAELLQAVSTTQDQSISRSFHAMVQRFQGDYDDPRQARDEGLDHDEHRFDRARDSLSGLLSKVRVMAGQGDKR